MRVGRNKQRGFTIVELLIVIVVIAILAAITTVAYNGVQDRVRATAMQSDLNQAMKSVLMFKTADASENYPTSLDQAGAKSSGNVTLQYSVDNNANPKTFCITATDTSMIGTSYYISDTVTSPTTGKCPNHSSNPENPNLVLNPTADITSGVVNVRTNVATDPRATAWSTGRWFGGGSGTGTYTTITGATDGPATTGITTYQRKTWTASGNSNSDTGFDAAGSITVTPGETYVASAYMRSSSSNTKTAQMNFYWTGGPGRTYGTTVSLPQGTWTRVSYVVTVPAGATAMRVVPDIANAGVLWAPGERLDGTGLLVEKTTALGSFFDGATVAAGDFTYAWNGTANASTSVQRALGVANYYVLTSENNLPVYQATVGGEKVARLLIPAGAKPSVWGRYFTVNIQDQSYSSVTALLTVSASQGFTSTIAISNDPGNSSFGLSPAITVGTTPAELRFKGTGSATTTDVNIRFSVPNDVVNVDRTIDIHRAMVVTGDYNDAYYE